MVALAATASGPSGPGARISKELIELGATAPGLVEPSPRLSRESGQKSQPVGTPRSEESATPVLKTPAQAASTSEQPRRKSRARLGLLFVLVVGAGMLRWAFWHPRAAVPAHAKSTSEAPRMVKWAVDSIPHGAQVVRADGQVLGATPWQVERPSGPGELALTLRYVGYKDQPLLLNYNTEITTEVRLQALPPPPLSPSEPLSDAAPKPDRTKRGRKLQKGHADHAEKRGPDTDVKLLFD
jgi:hypothetical protein